MSRQGILYKPLNVHFWKLGWFCLFKKKSVEGKMCFFILFVEELKIFLLNWAFLKYIFEVIQHPQTKIMHIMGTPHKKIIGLAQYSSQKALSLTYYATYYATQLRYQDP